MRTLAYAPYSDLNWLETKEPNLAQAQGFAKIIREAHPNKYVALLLTTSPFFLAIPENDDD